MSDAIRGEIVEDSPARNNINSIEGFEQAILHQWNKAVKSIIEVGRLLSEANNTLSNKEMLILCGNLGIKLRTRQRLIQIANYEPFQDTSILSYLPSSYSTLARIAQLPKDVFRQALEDKVINPDITGGAITSYINELKNLKSEMAVSPEKLVFFNVYINQDSIEAKHIIELADLKKAIDTIPHVRVELTKSAKRFLNREGLSAEHHKLVREMNVIRDTLVQKADALAEKEGRTFFAVTGYEKSKIYDFHVVAALKALNYDLTRFGISELVINMSVEEAHVHMGNDGR